MKFTAILSVVVTVTAVALIAFAPTQESALESQFYGFMEKYGKSYNSQAEVDFRMQVFKTNMEEAERLQALNPEATFGVNSLSDMTDEEFKVMLGDLNEEPSSPQGYVTETAERNGDISWISKMSPIQNQGSCGSCWAFAATATYEAWSNILGKGLTKLSEQELVDCVTKCNGCNGGLAQYGYEWLSQGTNAFCTLSSYQYTAKGGSCKSSTCQKAPFNKDKGYKLASGGEKVILAQLAKGPISVSVDAGVWKSYTGGVLSSCGQQTNHAVVVSAFHDGGSDASSYYTIRNSWGTGWGEKGYIRVAFNKNICNITLRPSFPIF